MAAHARRIVSHDLATKVLAMLPLKYPEQPKLTGPMPGPDDLCIFELKPVVVSVLDDAKGFGHTDLVSF